MSTDYRPIQNIRFSDLFDGRLERLGVREGVTEETGLTSRRCLTDGRNYVWVYKNSDDEFVDRLVRYRLFNLPGEILGAIAESFDTDIVSEYEPKFWGYETQEAWDAAQSQIHQEQEDEFYVDVLRYVRDEEHELRPGSIGLIKTIIAKKLIADDPDLALPEQIKETLLQTIHEIYFRDHAVIVKLSDADVASAMMAVTHEDDLPQG